MNSYEEETFKEIELGGELNAQLKAEHFLMSIDTIYQHMAKLLKKLYADHPLQATKILNSAMERCKSGQHEKSKSKNRELCKWLYEATRQLDQYGCSTSQRAHWIINSLHEFPACIVCGKPVSDPKQFLNVQKGYKPFCSVHCAKKHGSVVSKEARIQKNNGKYFSEESMQKAKKTFIEHYGVDNNMKCEEGKKAYRKAVQQKYGDGIVNVFQAEETKLKMKATKLQRYGDENWNNSEKSRQTCKSYGDSYYYRKDQLRRQTCLLHYGVDHHMKVPEIQQRVMQKHKGRNSYEVDEYLFDSLPEFCFYVCCRDFCIDVQCHPTDKAIAYVDAFGDKHIYYPDFYLPTSGKIIEVKGDHFFKDHDPSKHLVQPFGKNSRDFTKAQAISKAKSDVMAANNVIILSSRRYMLYVKHVKRAYGMKWIRMHKVHSAT